MEYMATFFTHFGAIKYKRFLASMDIIAETMPVPRKYSSNCGIGVKFSTTQDIRQLISEDIEKIFALQDDKDLLIYDNS